MVPRKILLTGLRILAVCLLFMICFGLGGVLSGLDKIGQQSVTSQQPQTVNQQLPQMPGNLLRTFLIFTLCVGSVLSLKEGARPTVFVHADTRAKYGDVAAVIDQVRQAGIQHVGIITSQRQPLPR